MMKLLFFVSFLLICSSSLELPLEHMQYPPLNLLRHYMTGITPGDSGSEASVSRNSIQWQEKFHQGMPIDHFGFGSNKTFPLRYLINQTMWKPGGPIIFGVGCENPIDVQVHAFGFNWKSAQLLHGMVVFIEHRYFGKSLPFGSQSFSSLDKLRYLSSEQALADYAVVLDWLKQNISGLSNSAVIGIGGSYCGLLAAAVRIKYPHIVTGSIAAAAPVNPFVSVCNAYARVVTQTFNTSVPGCANKIRSMWPIINSMMTTVTTYKPVSCYNISNPLPAYFNGSLLSPAWSFIFQSCMELGQLSVDLLCSDGVTDMFYPQHVPLQYMTNYCQKKYWNQAVPRPHFLTTNYGGLRLKWASNIVFTNGEFDPTHALSPTSRVQGWDHSMWIFNINGSAHGEEVQWPYTPPPPSVSKAKLRMLATMALWSNSNNDLRCPNVHPATVTQPTVVQPSSTVNSKSSTHPGSITTTQKSGASKKFWVFPMLSILLLVDKFGSFLY